MDITDAELSLHDGIVAAAKATGAKGFHVDVDYLLSMIRELRKLRDQKKH